MPVEEDTKAKKAKKSRKNRDKDKERSRKEHKQRHQEELLNSLAEGKRRDRILGNRFFFALNLWEDIAVDQGKIVYVVSKDYPAVSKKFLSQGVTGEGLVNLRKMPLITCRVLRISLSKFVSVQRYSFFCCSAESCFTLGAEFIGGHSSSNGSLR